MGGDACVIGSWPSAGAAAPRVKPPANVAPLFRSSRRLKRFEPIGLSLADEPKRKSLSRSRKYTPVTVGCAPPQPVESARKGRPFLATFSFVPRRATAFGISVNRWEPQNVLHAMDTGVVDTVQVVYNL